ncbi:TM2 domain-containing protein [Schaalia vaccimaxillae]|uniref:TM2 domain-containing protein n=1 Tax=Schaalia vaccimaxillae TaxID=183916 RepID=UPI0003B7B155|nr:TM2 domain-containing protein [Schaalia vaccimaxillae]
MTTPDPQDPTYGQALDTTSTSFDANVGQHDSYGQQGYQQQGTYNQAPYGQAPYGQAAYGQPQPAYTAPVEQKPMIVAALLAFFLGYLGVHNFYLGHVSRGVIQLILTLTIIGSFVSAIWAFVEFILILMRSGSYAYDARGVPLS